MNWICRRSSRPLNVLAASGLLVGLTLLALAGTPARAGQLDAALLEQKKGAAENVLTELHKYKYKNVGVLPFHVDKGGKEKGYYVAPLSLNLTARLENALILSQASDGELVGIIRDAAGTAPAEGLAAYQSDKRSRDDYKKLFEQEYTLAWSNQKGKEKVKADAFLTGRIINPAGTGKEKYVKIVIELIDPQSWDASSNTAERKPLITLTVLRDRALCADLGISYAMPSENVDAFLTGRGPASSADQLFGPTGKWRNKATPKPDDFGGISFALYYQQGNEKSKKQKLEYNAEGHFVTEPPPDKAKITIVLERLADDSNVKRRGVVVRMNGQSLWNMEKVDPINCRKWLFDPGDYKEQEFKGFYFATEGENLYPFEAVDANDAKVTGNKRGWIDVTVFGEKEEEVEAPKEPTKAPNALVLLGRGVKSSYDGKTRSVNHTSVLDKPLQEVQEALQKDNNVVVTPIKFVKDKELGARSAGNLIAHSGKAETGGLIQKGKPLKNPTVIASIHICYNVKVAK